MKKKKKRKKENAHEVEILLDTALRIIVGYELHLVNSSLKALIYNKQEAE